jgi:hypothetical protein
LGKRITGPPLTFFLFINLNFINYKEKIEELKFSLIGLEEYYEKLLLRYRDLEEEFEQYKKNLLNGQ